MWGSRAAEAPVDSKHLKVLVGGMGRNPVYNPPGTRSMQSTPIKPSKKRYETPSLTVHGTVQKLTQKVGVHGAADGGTFLRVKTAI
ncbi:MAG: lasso RiPP family leader peptide-containing protein [Candidatus Acidiferrales bacterium]